MAMLAPSEWALSLCDVMAMLKSILAATAWLSGLQTLATAIEGQQLGIVDPGRRDALQNLVQQTNKPSHPATP